MYRCDHRLLSLSYVRNVCRLGVDWRLTSLPSLPSVLCWSCSYDITTSEITSFIRIPLEFVDKVEIGELSAVGAAGGAHTLQVFNDFSSLSIAWLYTMSDI